jgi:ATP-dependent DNA helicase DinG
VLENLGLREFVALDLETTGLDADSERVIEIGAARFRDGGEVEHLEQLVNPGRPLDPFITALTGLTDGDLHDQPPFSTVADTLEDFVSHTPIVGQNVAFDLAFLAAEGKRLSSHRNSADFRFAQNEVLDTALLGRVFWPEWPRFGLSSLAERFGVVQASAHRALADARTVGQVLCAMLEILPERIWEEMADDLAYLIGGTFHPAERFFGRVAALAKGRKQERTVLSLESESEKSREHDAGELPSPEEVFGQDGRLKRVLSHFEARPAQLQMAQAVQSALMKNQILLCEAPTGVGKSLAYLFASALWISEDPRLERQVIVSSHTKALQEQLQRKEMRTLRDLGIPVRGAVLKGRDNYLCRRRLRNLIREAPLRLSDEDRIRLMPLVRWSATTTTGDISETGAFLPTAAPWLWAQVCNDSMSCSGSRCTPAKGCFFRAAQERAARSQIVFVNHALLFTEPSRFLQKPAPLRKFVLDEGHHLERAVVSASSIRLDSFFLRGGLARLIEERSERGLLPRLMSARSHEARLDDEVRELLAEIRDGVRGMYGTVRVCFEELPKSLPLETEGGRAKLRFQQGNRVHQAILSTAGNLFVQWKELTAKLETVLHSLQKPGEGERISKEVLLELRSSLDNMAQIEAQLSKVLEADDSDWVFWVEMRETGRTSVSLHAAPMFVGSFLQKNFWALTDSVTVTSATLSVQGTFEHLEKKLGLTELPQERLQEEILPSSFDLAQQMLLLVPTYLPHPRIQSEGWGSGVEDVVSEVVRRFRRGTLVLTTSLEFLDRLAAALAPVAQSAKRTLLAQGRDGAPAELLEEFRRRRDAILLGAANFWEGVDVLGEALEILILARLPFDVPTEPWIAARMERLGVDGRDPFYELSLPDTILRLRQGLGRLIRHRQDRGIALITDSRIFTTRFGAMIQASLPVKARPVSSPEDLWELCRGFFAREKGSPANLTGVGENVGT